jgi:hypothetical protein
LPTGFRTKFYNYLFISYLLTSCVGPLMCIVLFKYWGDQWSMPELKTILLIGVALNIPGVLLMCLFRDSKALGNASEAFGHGSQSPTGINDGDVEGDTTKDSDDEEEDDDEEEAKFNQLMSESPTSCGGCVTLKSVPYIVFGADLIIATASGCTVKFFPLFFKNDCQMSPSEVQGIYVVVPLFMALFSTVGTKVR